MSRLTGKSENNETNYKVRKKTEKKWNDAIQNAINKLGKLENLEEELGCPLEVVFKAMKENISFQREDIITKEVHILEGFDSYIVYNKGRKRYELHTTFKAGRNNWIADLDLKDYGKAWWLKGEKNE